MTPKLLRVLKHALKSWLWIFLFGWFDRLAVLGQRKPGPGFLIVKLDAIGDFVLGSPIIGALLAEQESLSRPVTIVCDKRSQAIAETMFSSSTVIGVDTKSFIKNLRYRTGILRRVAGIADTAINLALSHDLLWADAIIRVSGARRREGFHGPMDRVGCLGQAIALASYTVLIEPLSDTQFDAESIRQGLLQSGYAVSNLSSPFLHAALPDCVHHVPEGPFFVIAPGSLIPIKKWPAEQFVDLCRWLIDRTGWRCILLGAVGDKVEAAIVAKALPNKVVDLTGKTNLLEAASIIRSSQLVIANDSALVHIAAATGVASAATVGGGHPDRFLPYPKSFTSFRAPQIARHVMECYGCSWKCIFPLRIDQPSPCIAEVSQADMRAAVDRALAASK